MKIPFNSPARKRLIAGVALLLGALYLFLAARQFAASLLGNRTGLTSLKAATWLDPGNADYHNHLAHYYDLVASDPVAAIGQYKEAVRLNSHSARYWFDLASAYQVLGNTANQTVAMERAIQADSMTPDVAWEAANLYTVQGKNESAFRQFRVVMANDSSMAAEAIGKCWRIKPDVDLMLRDVVPPTADAYLAFLTLLQSDTDHLISKLTSTTPDPDLNLASTQQQIKMETAATFKVWDALLQSRQPFEERRAYEYIRFLIQRGEVDKAVRVWQQTATRFDRSSYLTSPDNLVVNGNFSLDVLNNGFDWQYEKQPGVHLTLYPLDPQKPHGQRALLITFDGPGITDSGFYQFIPVQPSTTYKFSAQYRNEGEQEGAGGPHFTIQDMYSQAIYYESDELKQSDESKENDALKESKWKPVDSQFTTGPDCKLVVLHVRRLPAGSPIRGKLWIGDFHIVRKPS
jgi:hypothetical protein